MRVVQQIYNVVHVYRVGGLPYNCFSGRLNEGNDAISSDMYIVFSVLKFQVVVLKITYMGLFF